MHGFILHLEFIRSRCVLVYRLNCGLALMRCRAVAHTPRFSESSGVQYLGQTWLLSGSSLHLFQSLSRNREDELLGQQPVVLSRVRIGSLSAASGEWEPRAGSRPNGPFLRDLSILSSVVQTPRTVFDSLSAIANPWGIVCVETVLPTPDFATVPTSRSQTEDSEHEI